MFSPSFSSLLVFPRSFWTQLGPVSRSVFVGRFGSQSHLASHTGFLVVGSARFALFRGAQNSCRRSRKQAKSGQRVVPSMFKSAKLDCF